MWKPREWKMRAKQSFKRNYWSVVAVCFIMAILVGRYGITTIAVYQYDNDVQFATHVVNTDAPITGWDYVNKMVLNQSGKTLDAALKASPFGEAGRSICCAAVNAITQPYKYMFQWTAALQMFLFGKISQGVALSFGGLIAIAFYLFVGNILYIGERRFFLESRLYSGTKISRIGVLYQKQQITNPTFIMTCRNVFQFLWNFTIIGGIIKYYDYKMIPYILAENPKISCKKAFSLSKQMIKGYRRKALLLDLSFAGWMILQPLTLGILGVLFVNPYYTSTMTELYISLRRECIENKISFFEELNDPYLEQIPTEEEWKNSNGYLSV